MNNDLTTIPLLWAAYNPRLGNFFIDQHEKYVREMASFVPGATVQRLDVPALLRAKQALGALCDAIDDAITTNAVAIDEAVAEGRAALAALDTPTDPSA